MKRSSPDLGASLVLIFPLLLAYEIGVLFVGRVNGADLVTRALYEAVPGRGAYLIVHAAIALGFLWWIRRTGRWNTLSLPIVGPLVLEAMVYALTLGAVVGLLVDRLLGLGLGAGVVSALGAGIYEELVFRLALISALVVLVGRVADRRIAIAVALVVSSVAFAAAHHLGAHGEPWAAHAFAFRCFAGLAFGLIFWFRSFAHAVYAHALYDLLVACS